MCEGIEFMRRLKRCIELQNAQVGLDVDSERQKPFLWHSGPKDLSAESLEGEEARSLMSVPKWNCAPSVSAS